MSGNYNPLLKTLYDLPISTYILMIEIFLGGFNFSIFFVKTWKDILKKKNYTAVINSNGFFSGDQLFRHAPGRCDWTDFEHPRGTDPPAYGHQLFLYGVHVDTLHWRHHLWTGRLHPNCGVSCKDLWS